MDSEVYDEERGRSSLTMQVGETEVTDMVCSAGSTVNDRGLQHPDDPAVGPRLGERDRHTVVVSYTLHSKPA